MTINPSAGTGPELEWFKSSYSTNDGPECVEVAIAPSTIHIRDSKNKQGPHLTFGPAEWATFVSHASGH